MQQIVKKKIKRKSIAHGLLGLVELRKE